MIKQRWHNKKIERYKAEDDELIWSIEARNKLDSYVFQVRSTIGSNDKMDPEDKETIKSVLEESTKWLDNNQHVTKEEYEEKQKDLESKILPLLQKGLDPSAMIEWMPKPPSNESHYSEPKIEEID